MSVQLADTSAQLMAEVHQNLCCWRRVKSSDEKREHDALREALARKQEEVRRLQAQVALDTQQANVEQATLSDRAAVRIQSLHRGKLARSPGPMRGHDEPD